MKYKLWCPIKEYPKDLIELIKYRVSGRRIDLDRDVDFNLTWSNTPESQYPWSVLCYEGNLKPLIDWHNEHNTEFLKELRGNTSYSIF